MKKKKRENEEQNRKAAVWLSGRHLPSVRQVLGSIHSTEGKKKIVGNCDLFQNYHLFVLQKTDVSWHIL